MLPDPALRILLERLIRLMGNIVGFRRRVVVFFPFNLLSPTQRGCKVDARKRSVETI
jgi:hypothetical protein